MAWVGYTHADQLQDGNREFVKGFFEDLDAATQTSETEAWCKTCRTDAEQRLAANAAQLVRDQAALAQIRLLIAAHRPRLRLAAPNLLTKLDRVLEQPAELGPAQAGE
ncbi:hypothetical protein [Streptomyces mirabilis]|uniref:hypothetical protein n=1 Tax=Streptomyces mirabilis TaxID=68239 RepID=UPI003802849D